VGTQIQVIDPSDSISSLSICSYDNGTEKILEIGKIWFFIYIISNDNFYC